MEVTLVNIDVVDSGRDDFVTKSLANTGESVKERDNLRFDLFQSQEDPTKCVLLEVYASEKGVADHKTTAHYQAWREGVADHMATPRKGVRYRAAFPSSPSGFKYFWYSAPGNWPESGPLDITLVQVHVKAGTEDAFTAATVENATASVGEPGNLRFDVLQELADPTRFVLVEVYQTAEEAAKHKTTAHYLKWREAVADMMAEPRQGKKCAAPGTSQPWRWAVPPVLARKAPPPACLEVPTQALSDGRSMPVLGFGCYKVGVVPGSATGAAGATDDLAPVRQVLADALAAGYRCFDSAQFYENEAQVGEVLHASGIPRDQLYLISKVWTDKVFEGPSAVREQVLASVRDLQCEYLDLYMVHWPVPGKHVDAYKELVALQKEGLVKSVGVANYTIEDIEELRQAGLPLPVVNQIEINPFLYRKRTIDYCQGLGIHLQAYRALSLFGKPASQSHQTVCDVAAKHGRMATQVLGRWCVQKGFLHIPKSTKRARMDENANLFDFSLDKEDLAALDSLTTKENLDIFGSTYMKCVVRDTPLEGTPGAARTEFTVD